MPFRSASLIFPAVLLPLIASACAQDQSKPNALNPSAQQPYVLQSTTRLVQVTVIVHDPKGSPVTGLKKEDFTLLDSGEPQQIAFFSATAPTVGSPHPPAAGVFTNRSDLKGQDPGNIIVILFDALNTSFLDQAYARQHVLRFLQHVKPQDHIAIFALTNDLLPLHDFSEDVASLQSSVNRFSPRLLAAFDASHPDNFHVSALASDPSWRAFENHVNNATAEIADYQIANRYRLTYAAISCLADYVANIPGHKSLIWVTDGIPIQIGDGKIGVPDRDAFRLDDSTLPGMASDGNLNGIARILNRVDMAIYPVDARGVETDDSSSAFFSRGSVRDTYQSLADDSGGKAFYGNNDIAGSIYSAVEDDRFTYTVGYYPDHGTWDGKFRKIKIALNVPGSHLRYRQGYFALQEPPSETIMRTDLAEAARTPLDATALGVTVKGKSLDPKSARQLQIQISLDPKQFLLHDQNNRKEGGLDLLFLQKDAAGKYLAAEKQHYDVNFKQKEYDSLAKVGLILQRRLAIDPTSDQIRIFVRDVGSGQLGSVTIPVKQFF